MKKAKEDGNAVNLSIALCCDRHSPRWLQVEISNSIYSNVYLKVKQVCLEAIYRDHLIF